MHSYKKLAVLVAVFALSVIGAANASASTFTVSATGSLTGKATSTHTLTMFRVRAISSDTCSTNLGFELRHQIACLLLGQRHEEDGGIVNVGHDVPDAGASEE